MLFPPCKAATSSLPPGRGLRLIAASLLSDFQPSEPREIHCGCFTVATTLWCFVTAKTLCNLIYMTGPETEADSCLGLGVGRWGVRAEGGGGGVTKFQESIVVTIARRGMYETPLRGAHYVGELYGTCIISQ